MLKIGEYFRTPWGDIGKITDIPKHNKYFDDGFYLEGKFITCGSEAMKELNSTPKIIDLIEINDFVNQEEVILIQEIRDFSTMEEYKEIVFRSGYKIRQEDIKSIVTREMYESMEYKVGE